MLKLRRGAVIALVLLSSCARMQRAQVATEAKSAMIGMPKERVLACMGAPAHQAAAGETEVWSYPSGGDTYSFGTASGSTNMSGDTTISGATQSLHRYCMVNVVMMGGKVSDVNYTGRTGGWASQGEQCAFAVQNCVH
jgi:hypothetical protein